MPASLSLISLLDLSACATCITSHSKTDKLSDGLNVQQGHITLQSESNDFEANGVTAVYITLSCLLAIGKYFHGLIPPCFYALPTSHETFLTPLLNIHILLLECWYVYTAHDFTIILHQFILSLCYPHYLRYSRSHSFS